MIKIALLSFVFVTLIGCGQKEVGNLGVVEASGVGSTSELRWPENLIPIKIRFPKSLESQLYQSVYYAVEEWNIKADRPLLYFEFADFTTAMPDDTYDSKNNFYSQNNWAVTGYANGVLAITRFYYYNNILLEADIVLNNTRNYHYNSLADDTIASNQFDVQSILLHEFGHFLGFDHTNESDSVMKPTLSSGSVVRYLSQKDVERLLSRY